MYVVYNNCLYFLSIFWFIYNKNHLSRKQLKCILKIKIMGSLSAVYFTTKYYKYYEIKPVNYILGKLLFCLIIC